MKTALITGNSGFVGRHMEQRLKKDGWDVTEVDVAHGTDALEFFQGSHQIYDLIVHCAYEVGGRAHIDGVNMALAHNVVLDSLMFEWALRTKQRAVIYYSSSAVYPAFLQSFTSHTKLYEDDLDPGLVNSPDDYSWAKLTGERLARVVTDHGLRVVILRPFSGYGSDQDLTYPFPSLVKRASEGDLTVWGGKQYRDFIHIDDVIAGSLAVYESGDTRPVNLCTGIPTELGELAQMVWSKTHDGTPPDVEYLKDKPMGVYYRVGDPTRMLEHYKPKVSLDEGIKRALNV